MHPKVPEISPRSYYYVYAPSELAKKLYLYPVTTGYYIYEPGYFISRSCFDSFLLMYIAKGSCEITAGEKKLTAVSGQFVLLDCYTFHGYGSSGAWEALWLHFDGACARTFFEEITSRYGCVPDLQEREKPVAVMKKILDCFRKGGTIREDVISGWITDILNSLLLSAAQGRKSPAYGRVAADSISYINGHFREDVSLEMLARRAGMSLFHYIRIFAGETGVTPHQYLLSTRISAARFLLKSSEASVKEIAERTGFQSQSSFCTAFKKWEGITPGEYRNQKPVKEREERKD